MLNKVQFIGHLGRDPEVRYLPSGSAVCNFSVAATERWKDKQTGEQVERTEWLRCNAFERLAEVCGEFLMKGSLVYVEGSLNTRKYTDKDGVEKVSVECKLTSMKMLGPRPEGGGEKEQQAPTRAPAPSGRTAPAQARAAAPAPSQAPRRAPAAAATGFDDMDDDIPF
jgi:single-strand DNA-binding protein